VTDLPFFLSVDTAALSALIEDARGSIVYAAPGMNTQLASAIVAVSTHIGIEAIVVYVDFNERVMRMGYGELKAIEMLRNSGITVSNVKNLRSGLIIVDEVGFSFTPTALYLEAEMVSHDAFNAIRLTQDQIKEALARLSPVAKAIAIAQAGDDEEKERLKELSLDIEPKIISEEDYENRSLSLQQAPPTKFDVARQVRVYESYIQYVEMSLTGAAVQRHRITLPKSLQRIGESSKEIEGRLRTTFDLIDKNGELSSKPLEDNLSEIRNNFTQSLGREHGRVLLKSVKWKFEERIEEFREELVKFSEEVKASLEGEMTRSRNTVCDYYLPLVSKNPPDQLLGGLLGAPSDDDLRCWINEQLDKCFPSVEYNEA
jgi:hypothetical protein